MLPAQPNQSLLDGIEVLLALAASDSSVGTRELGRQLGLEQTRVNRLLKTLAAAGIAAQTADRRYVPGPGMHVLSAMSLFGSGLVTSAMPTLQRLSRFKLIVALGVLWRDRVAYLYHCLPGMQPAEAIGRADLFPATRSSIGMALLANKSSDELDLLFRDGTGGDFGSRRALDRALAAVRRSGVAAIPGTPGESRAAAISMPGQPPYAAVAVSGRITGRISLQINDALIEAATAIADAASPASRKSRAIGANSRATGAKEQS